LNGILSRGKVAKSTDDCTKNLRRQFAQQIFSGGV
jgi:hypothetical protein